MNRQVDLQTIVLIQRRNTEIFLLALKMLQQSFNLHMEHDEFQLCFPHTNFLTNQILYIHSISLIKRMENLFQVYKTSHSLKIPD